MWFQRLTTRIEHSASPEIGLMNSASRNPDFTKFLTIVWVEPPWGSHLYSAGLPDPRLCIAARGLVILVVFVCQKVTVSHVKSLPNWNFLPFSLSHDYCSRGYMAEDEGFVWETRLLLFEMYLIGMDKVLVSASERIVFFPGLLVLKRAGMSLEHAKMEVSVSMTCAIKAQK